MIRGPIARDPVLKTVCLLHESKFPFVFTGSRAAGTNTVNSDYDFVVQYSEEVIEYLRAFMSEVSRQFPALRANLDQNTHAIFSKGKRNECKVDVCVVLDLDWRLKMIDYVNQNYSKAQQKEFTTHNWNQMYLLCQN